MKNPDRQAACWFAGAFLVALVTFALRRWLFCGILSLLLGALSGVGLLLLFLKTKLSAGRFRTMLLVFHILFCLVLASFLVTEGFVLSSSLKAQKAEALPAGEVAVVLVPGCGLVGEEPSLLFSLRLKKARELWEGDKNLKIVVCGCAGNDESLSEAAAGKKYLLSLGVPEEAVYTEEESRDTIENVRYFAKMFPDVREVYLCTNDFHVFRTSLIARRMGITVHALSYRTPRFFLRVNYYTREYLSLIFYFLQSHGLAVDIYNSHL